MNGTSHKRQEGHNRSNDMHVFARIRPVDNSNGDNNSKCVEVHQDGRRVTISDGQRGTGFSFDECFGADSGQADVFKTTALPLVEKFISGHNCCVVAYGEENAGKTYSLMGRLPTIDGDDQNSNQLDENDDVSSLGSHGASEVVSRPDQIQQPSSMSYPPLQVQIHSAENSLNSPLHPESTSSHPHTTTTSTRQRQSRRRSTGGFANIPLNEGSGIIPRVINSLYSALNTSQHSTVPTHEGDQVIFLHCSYIMIYLEKVVDLLAFSGQSSDESKEKLNFLKLKGSRSEGGVYVDGVTERHCATDSQVYELLHQGMQNRRLIESKFRADLSRSHSIFTIKLEMYRRSRKSKQISRMNFCDWANSGAQHKSSSKASSKETKMNKAHDTIKNIIKTFNSIGTDTDQNSKPPYSDSKVTYFLKDAFGGNCITMFLLNVLPTKANTTMETFHLGSGLKKIMNNSKVNMIKGSVPDRYKTYYHDTSSSSNLIHTISEGSNEFVSHCSNEEKLKSRNQPSSMSSTVNDTRITEATTDTSTRTHRSMKGSNLDSLKSLSRTDGSNKSNTHTSSDCKPHNGTILPDLDSRLPLRTNDHQQISKGETPKPNRAEIFESTGGALEDEKKSLDHSGEVNHSRNHLVRNMPIGKKTFSFSDSENTTNEGLSYRELTLAENMLKLSASSKTGITLSSLESVRGAAKHMEEDLAAARNELTTVYALLQASARRMEEELIIAQKDVFARSSEPTQLLQSHSAFDIENDLIAARKELDNLKYFQNGESEQADPTNRQIAQKLSLSKYDTKFDSGNMEKNIDDIIKETLVKVGDSSFSDVEKQVVALKLENASLARSKQKQDEELEKARRQIKALSLRVTEGQRSMEQLFNINDTMNEKGLGTIFTKDTRSRLVTENLAVSNVIESPVNLNDFFSESVEKTARISEKDYLERESSIQVYLRLRPMSKLETSRRSRSCIELEEDNKQFFVDSPLDGEYDFCYDKTFDTNVSQCQIYNLFGGEIVDDLLHGINHCIIGCGLTSSGKTYTLIGTLPEPIKDDDSYEKVASLDQNESTNFVDDSNVGLTPRLVCDFFKKMYESSSNIQFSVKCSFVAIYHEKIFDLLEPQREKILSVKETNKGVEIDGASTAFCYDELDVFALIQRGEACKSVLTTRMNIDANRTHSIFSIHIEKKNLCTGHIVYSRLQIADLAGFEIGLKNKGQSILDSKIVHRSFTAFGNVVKALADKNNNAPYRESKLTCVLKDALGGNCKTKMFVTASPSSYNISETINAIRLGQRVRRLVNKVNIIHDVSKVQYKQWCLTSEVKFCDLKAFVKNLSRDITKHSDSEKIQESALSISPDLWKSINSLLKDEEIVENPCAYFLEAGKLDEMKKCSLKWRILSTELAKKAPSENFADAISARENAEAQLYDIQTEASVLRRLNENLVSEKKKNEEKMSVLKKDLKLQALKISELEHKLKMSEYREKKTVMFLKHLRKICWRLQKDVSRNRSIDISEITSCISGAPDLSGLVDLDYLLIETGLIDQRELLLNDDNEEYEKLIELTDYPPDGTFPDNDEDDGLENQNLGEHNDLSIHNNLQPRNWLRHLGSGHWHRRDDEVPHEYNDIVVSDQKYEHRSRKEKHLECDLRNMTNKCIELQMLLNEERANVDALTNRSGSLTKKRLAQEAIALRKERDRMMHNAKAATWKLQELHVVNKVLAKKSAETVQHVTFLEEGFKKLQETFRSTVLDSLDSDTALRDRLAHLESVVESLTVPQSREIEYDALSRPVHRMNLPIRGQTVTKGDIHNSPYFETVKFNRRCLSLNHSLKQHEFMPCAKVRRKSKFKRRSIKTKESFGGVQMKIITSRFRRSQTRMPTFQGNLKIFSFFGRH